MLQLISAGNRHNMEVKKLCEEIKRHVRGTKVEEDKVTRDNVTSSLQDVIFETVEDVLEHCQMVDDVREVHIATYNKSRAILFPCFMH